MLAVVPAVALAGGRLRPPRAALARDVQDALAAAGEIAEESIAGLRTVRSFDAEQHEAGRYGRRHRARLPAGAPARASPAHLHGRGLLRRPTRAAVLVFWYGGRLVSHGDMTIGALTSFLVYTLIVAFALGGLADLWADFMRASGAAERVFELLDRVPAIAGQRAGCGRPGAEGRVELANVRFAYPTRPDAPVLRNLELTLAPGEVVALVGPSGAGKSTIAALLPRFYDPQAGRVASTGTTCARSIRGWLRRQIGIVAQEPVLFSTTIAENIRYGRPGATARRGRGRRRAPPTPTASSCRFPGGYDTLVGERGVQLSGGQKQRVAIARAVLKDPAAAGPRRGHQRARRRERAPGQGGARAPDARPHHAGHRPPPLDGGRRRPGGGLDGGEIVQSGPHAR